MLFVIFTSPREAIPPAKSVPFTLPLFVQLSIAACAFAATPPAPAVEVTSPLLVQLFTAARA